MKNIGFEELNEMELTNTNGGRRIPNWGRIIGGIGVVQTAIDFGTGFVKGFVDYAKGR